MEKKEQWRSRIERWQRSGLSRTEFAEREQVKVQALSNWKWTLGKEAGASKPKARAAKATFVELVPRRRKARVQIERRELVEANSVSENFEIRFPSGVRLMVPARFDSRSVGALISVLEGD